MTVKGYSLMNGEVEEVDGDFDDIDDVLNESVLFADAVQSLATMNMEISKVDEQSIKEVFDFIMEHFEEEKMTQPVIDYVKHRFDAVRAALQQQQLLLDSLLTALDYREGVIDCERRKFARRMRDMMLSMEDDDDVD